MTPWRLLLLFLLPTSVFSATSEACRNVLAGTVSIIAMYHKLGASYYLLTSNGDLFIEPADSFNATSDPPTLLLSSHKYTLPSNWSIDGAPATIEYGNKSSTDVFVITPMKRPGELGIMRIRRQLENICTTVGKKLGPTAAIETDYSERSNSFTFSDTLPTMYLVDAAGTYAVQPIKEEEEEKLILKTVLRLGFIPPSDRKLPLTVIQHGIWMQSDHPPTCGLFYTQDSVTITLLINDDTSVSVYRTVNGVPNISTRYHLNSFIRCSEENTFNTLPWATPSPPLAPLLYVLLTAIIVGFILLFACVSICKKRKSCKPDTVPVLSSLAISRASRMSTVNKLSGGGFTSPVLFHQLMQTSKGHNLATLEQLLTGQVPQTSRANSRAPPNRSWSPRASALSALEKVGNSLVSPLKKLKNGRKKKRKKKKRRKRQVSRSETSRQ